MRAANKALAPATASTGRSADGLATDTAIYAQKVTIEELGRTGQISWRL